MIDEYVSWLLKEDSKSFGFSQKVVAKGASNLVFGFAQRLRIVLCMSSRETCDFVTRPKQLCFDNCFLFYKLRKYSTNTPFKQLTVFWVFNESLSLFSDFSWLSMCISASTLWTKSMETLNWTGAPVQFSVQFTDFSESFCKFCSLFITYLLLHLHRNKFFTRRLVIEINVLAIFCTLGHCQSTSMAEFRMFNGFCSNRVKLFEIEWNCSKSSRVWNSMNWHCIGEWMFQVCFLQLKLPVLQEERLDICLKNSYLICLQLVIVNLEMSECLSIRIILNTKYANFN